MPRIVTNIMRQADFVLSGARSNDVLFLVNVVLESLYPPPPDTLPACLEVISAVYKLIEFATPSQVLLIVSAIERSCSVWIEDRMEVLSEGQYNDTVR